MDACAAAQKTALKASRIPLSFLTILEVSVLGRPACLPLTHAATIIPTYSEYMPKYHTCEKHVSPVAPRLWVLHVLRLHALEGGTALQCLPVEDDGVIGIVGT